MTYTPEFWTLETNLAYVSAQHTLPIVFSQTPLISSVIDIGCGTGAWAYIAQKTGRVILGVDHDVPPQLRLIRDYLDCDLVNGYPCFGFDLAICLEVAEHLPPRAARPLVSGLCQAPLVLFSAATPGQPGVNHINCRPHDYWHTLFADYGYLPEHIGPTLPEAVADFYRRNMYLYAS